MQSNITNYLQSVRFGNLQTHMNMSVLPLLADDMATADYLLLDEAFNEKVVEITETSVQGSVPELSLKNMSEKMLLLFDGEELIGAKQNRILSFSILLDGHSKTTIPVNCCEAGRWSSISEHFSTSSRIAFRKLRASKQNNSHSTQQEVWHQISARLKKRNLISSTSAMADIFENETDKASLNNYIQHFSSIDAQVGSVFFINGHVCGVEVFGKNDTYKKISSKLIMSYALDSIDENNGSVAGVSNAEVQAKQFMDLLTTASVHSQHSVGLGNHVRFTNNAAGASLIYQNQLLHLSAFPLEAQSGRQTQLLRSAMRRRRMQ